VPLIGLFIIISWGGYDLAGRWRLRPAVLGSTAVLAVAACIPFTRAQLSYWRNTEALFEHAIRFGSNNLIAEYNLAASYFGRGQYDEAAQHFAQVTKYYQQYALAHHNLGALAHSNLGLALARQGKTEEAMVSYQNALRCDPKLPLANFGLATLLINQGKWAEAAEHLATVVQVTTNYWEAYDQFGLALSKLGKAEDALDQFSKAVQINPKNPELRSHFAMALDRLGRTREAVAQYWEALSLNPKMSDVLNNLAWLLASHPNAEIRNGAEAVRLAEQACQLTDYHDAMIVGTLGAAYAEAGRFDEAVAAAEKARELALALGQKDLAEKNQQLIQLFSTRQPYREPAR
jgi:tetratricopeptide (TPR) repeat protein